MDFLFSFWQFFYANIFTKPQYFVGLIVLVGYLLLGRKWYDALAGFIKAVKRSCWWISFKLPSSISSIRGSFRITSCGY